VISNRVHPHPIVRLRNWRDTQAAKRLLRKLLKRQYQAPRVMITV